MSDAPRIVRTDANLECPRLDAALRERLRPYLTAQMATARDTGLPPMRPLFVDFPGDPAAGTIDDQFMLGPDLLVAPILAAGATARPVYLPKGSRWRDAWTEAEHEGGNMVEAEAPIDRLSQAVLFWGGHGLH